MANTATWWLFEINRLVDQWKSSGQQLNWWILMFTAQLLRATELYPPQILLNSYYIAEYSTQENIFLLHSHRIRWVHRIPAQHSPCPHCAFKAQHLLPAFNLLKSSEPLRHQVERWRPPLLSAVSESGRGGFDHAAEPLEAHWTETWAGSSPAQPLDWSGSGDRFTVRAKCTCTGEVTLDSS